jgi:hypothetical protein
VAQLSGPSSTSGRPNRPRPSSLAAPARRLPGAPRPSPSPPRSELNALARTHRTPSPPLPEPPSPSSTEL